MKAKILFILGFGASLAGSQATRAAEPPQADAPSSEAAKSDETYVVTLQGIGAFAPSFPGSAQLRAYPFPGVAVRAKGEPERFATPDDGFGVAVLDTGGLRAGPVANFVFFRGSIPGVHQVALTHEVGGFADFTPAEHFRAHSELRQGVDGHKGLVAALGADVFGSYDALTLSFGPRLSFGNNRYADAYYSVTPVEAAFNGRLYSYQAVGGFTAAGGMATIRYEITSNLNATVYGGLQRLTGSVAASPIPNNFGSRDQFTTGLAISRSFDVQKFW
ncbi:MAG TPA: MipA/OmpV family protein [Methylocystis sp.]|nr:MipA/OmpV family protein [Methylocystis sp.]